MGVSKKGGAHNKDSSILGSILGLALFREITL